MLIFQEFQKDHVTVLFQKTCIAIYLLLDHPDWPKVTPPSQNMQSPAISTTRIDADMLEKLLICFQLCLSGQVQWNANQLCHKNRWPCWSGSLDHSWPFSIPVIRGAEDDIFLTYFQWTSSMKLKLVLLRAPLTLLVKFAWPLYWPFLFQSLVHASEL